MRHLLVGILVLAAVGCSAGDDGSAHGTPPERAATAAPAAVAPVADVATVPVDTGVLTIVSRLEPDLDDLDAEPSDVVALDGCELVTEDTLVVWGELAGAAAPQRVRVEVELVAGDVGWSRLLEGRLSGSGSLAVPLLLEGEELGLARTFAGSAASCRLLVAGESLGEVGSEPVALAVAAGVQLDERPAVDASDGTE